MAQVFPGFWPLIALGGLIAVAGLTKGLGVLRRRAPEGDFDEDEEGAFDPDPESLSLIEAMCRAARSDGDVDAAERLQILTAAEALTGATVDPALIDRMIDHAAENSGAAHVRNLVARAPEEIHEAMMRGVLFVISARGKVVPPEWEFVTELALGMQMSGERLREMVAEIAELRAA